MFCPRPPSLSSAQFAPGKKPRARDPCRGGPRKSTPASGDDWTLLRRRSTRDSRDFRTDPRDFLRTIGVSRGERSARRCTVRAPSLQLWAIPRRGEPHNELTILPSISKLALYPCREKRSLPAFSLPSSSSLRAALSRSPWPARDEGAGGPRITFGDERKELRGIRTTETMRSRCQRPASIGSASTMTLE